jgi:hypothetical protein
MRKRMMPPPKVRGAQANFLWKVPWQQPWTFSTSLPGWTATNAEQYRVASEPCAHFSHIGHLRIWLVALLRVISIQNHKCRLHVGRTNPNKTTKRSVLSWQNEPTARQGNKIAAKRFEGVGYGGVLVS